MKINIDQVLKQAEQRKNEPVPLPKIRVGKSSAQPDQPVKSKPLQPQAPVDQRDMILKDLWAEISDIKTDRGKLSTRTWYLVEEIKARLQQESQSKLKAFLEGELADPELVIHYSKIEALTDRAAEVYEKIKYVEQYGKLPEAPKPSFPDAESANANALHYEIRRLDDLIYKTQKKIKGVAPKNPTRLNEWREKLAQAEAMRDEKKRELKKLQHEARQEKQLAER